MNDALDDGSNNVAHMASSMSVKIGSSYIIHDKAMSSAVVPLTRIIRPDSVMLLMYAAMVDSFEMNESVGAVVGMMVRGVGAVALSAAVRDMVGNVVKVNVGGIVGVIIGIGLDITVVCSRDGEHFPKPQNTLDAMRVTPVIIMHDDNNRFLVNQDRIGSDLTIAI